MRGGLAGFGWEGWRCGLTKKRMIHVSMTVRLAGRMENHDMEGGVDELWEADRYSRDTAEFIAWLS